LHEGEGQNGAKKKLWKNCSLTNGRRTTGGKLKNAGGVDSTKRGAKDAKRYLLWTTKEKLIIGKEGKITQGDVVGGVHKRGGEKKKGGWFGGGQWETEARYRHSCRNCYLPRQTGKQRGSWHSKGKAV